MSDGSEKGRGLPPFGRLGCPVPSIQPIGDAAYYDSMPRDSFMLLRYNIEPGQKVEISSWDDEHQNQWWGGPYFEPKHFIYIGTSNLWLVASDSRVNAQSLFPTDLPADSFRIPGPTFINWPTFGCFKSQSLFVGIENRGKEMGHFVARLAGKYVQDNYPPPRSLYSR